MMISSGKAEGFRAEAWGFRAFGVGLVPTDVCGGYELLRGALLVLT